MMMGVAIIPNSDFVACCFEEQKGSSGGVRVKSNCHAPQTDIPNILISSEMCLQLLTPEQSTIKKYYLNRRKNCGPDIEINITYTLL